MRYSETVLEHVLNKYRIEHRQMKGCEPRDLLDRATDICLFEGHPLELTIQVLDVAWRNYFGTSHGFDATHHFVPSSVEHSDNSQADPLEL
jgi:hypothetical protein